MKDLGAILDKLSSAGYAVENLRSKAGVIEVIYPAGTAQQVIDATTLANSWVNPDATMDTALGAQTLPNALSKALAIKTRILAAEGLKADLVSGGKTSQANNLQTKIDAWQSALDTRISSI